MKSKIKTHLYLLTIFMAFAVTVAGNAKADLRVLSFNIKHANTGLDRIAAVINGVDADVACLQEVDDYAIRTEFDDQAWVLSWMTNMPHYRYQPTGTYDEINAPPYSITLPNVPALYETSHGQEGHRGIAILSKHPITDVRVTHVVGSTHPRAVLTATVTKSTALGNVISDVSCTHYPLSSSTRQTAANTTVAVTHPSRPSFLAGDLNARPSTPEMITLLGTYDNPASAEDPTRPVGAPTRQIDYVLHANLDTNWSVSSFGAVTSDPFASDHLPYYAEHTLSLNGPAGVPDATCSTHELAVCSYAGASCELDAGGRGVCAWDTTRDNACGQGVNQGIWTTSTSTWGLNYPEFFTTVSERCLKQSRFVNGKTQCSAANATTCSNDGASCEQSVTGAVCAWDYKYSETCGGANNQGIWTTKDSSWGVQRPNLFQRHRARCLLETRFVQ